MKKIPAYIAATLSALVPFVASAQTLTSVTAQQITSFQTFAAWLIQGINTILVPLLFAASFVVFIYGVFDTLILGRGNEEKSAEGRTIIIWGVVGFVVMLSVWGLVSVATNTLNLNNSAPQYPTAPTATSH